MKIWIKFYSHNSCDIDEKNSRKIFDDKANLCLKCPGSKVHSHAWAWGTACNEAGDNVHLAGVAGRYPLALTQAIGAAVCTALGITRPQ